MAGKNYKDLVVWQKAMALVEAVRGKWQAMIELGMSVQQWVVPLQWAIRTLPFLNARLQGNYRLFRMATGKERRKMVAARLASIALFTAVLYFWNMTEYEEEWENLNDWDKDMYWHIKPGTRFHIRIPKPFEIGLFAGTAVERSLAALVYQAYGDERLLTALAEDVKPGASFGYNPVRHGGKCGKP